MKKLKILSLILTIIFSFNCHGKEKAPFLTVQEFFAAISDIDHPKLKETTTEDFQLLENGEIWDVDKLISVIQPSKVKRQNYFNLVTSEISGNMAWVSYWNRAKFSIGDKVQEVLWLESAVLTKEKSDWLIQMLHSTKINPERLPKNIVMTEYFQ